MSLRIKSALVIASIVFVFTVANFFTNFSFTRKKMIEAMEQDLVLALSIADDLVSTRIRLLKADAETVAERLLKLATGKEMEDAMVHQLELYPEFISLTVHGRGVVVANYGEPVDQSTMMRENHHIQKAFLGTSTISSPYYSRVTSSFLMHVFVPMGNDMVLSATIPGMTFVDIVGGYRLWQTGSIYVVDGEGTFIASYLTDLVTERQNYIVEANNSPDLESSGKFIKNMITSDQGAGRYVYGGLERFCVFKHITSSNAGWRIAVTAPLSESPESTLRQGLMLSSIIFLLVGVVVSFFVSAIVARPFYKIEAQNKELADLNETVQAASREKSKFLAQMSHEMRTPLNAIIGLSELTLDADEIHDESRQNLEKIYNAGETLLSTVNDLLDISKIEAGKFELVPVVYDTPSMINDAITQSIMRKGEKPIEFMLNVDENIPTKLYGDDLRVKQVLNNLLSNAFKYTKEGTVELTVCRESSAPAEAGQGEGIPSGSDAVWLSISVKDTGIGIHPENIDSLFRDYTQIDTTSNRKIEGTGLGLAITRMMVEIMGGTISVESEYGKGSVFSVRFPQKSVTDAIIGPEVVVSLKNFRYSANKRDMYSQMVRVSMPYARVLVVDDVATNLDVARGMMKPYHMEVDCLSSGQQAIEAVREEKVRYNAIFMDHMMPGMDGIEATRIIREEIGTEYAKTVPIIALTANAIVGNEEMFLASGFQAFISKPIEIRRLDSIIKQWVRDKELEKKLEADRATTEKDAPANIRTGRDRRSGWERRKKSNDRRLFIRKVDGLDITNGLRRFGGDKESYAAILQSFVTNTRPLLEATKNVTKGSLKDYAITVHGIKGSCRGICAEAVGDMAENLEGAAKRGDIGFVTSNNESFITTATKLLVDIDGALNESARKQEKPKKAKPDADALTRLLAACKNFDTTKADEIVKEIDRFEYESDEGLALWLRENVDQMNYSEIAERLSGMVAGQDNGG